MITQASLWLEPTIEGEVGEAEGRGGGVGGGWGGGCAAAAGTTWGPPHAFWQLELTQDKGNTPM